MARPALAPSFGVVFCTIPETANSIAKFNTLGHKPSSLSSSKARAETSFNREMALKWMLCSG